MPREKKRRRRYHTVHECMADLLSRDDLQHINRLGLWSFFASVDQVKQFAAQPREERRQFFDRFEKALDDGAGDRRPAGDYGLFGLSETATVAEIQARYRELALAFHPDRREGDVALMQEINAAYQRLLVRAGD